MRLVAAMMKHETNTFSPVPTPLARFARGRRTPARGEEALREFQGTGSGLGAYIDLAREHGAELHIPLAAGAWPSGVVEDAAYEAMSEAILEGVAASAPDAILLDLHGAMVTESLEDGEGELLRRIREIAPATPIGVALDMHANMYPAITQHADVVAGYQTYPHVDSYETALRAGRPIVGMLA
ncbi:MAG: M81 family metallopeptidase, partial [Alphaproteobacteria bacterium]